MKVLRIKRTPWKQKNKAVGIRQEMLRVWVRVCTLIAPAFFRKLLWRFDAPHDCGWYNGQRCRLRRYGR